MYERVAWCNFSYYFFDASTFCSARWYFVIRAVLALDVLKSKVVERALYFVVGVVAVGRIDD